VVRGISVAIFSVVVLLPVVRVASAQESDRALVLSDQGLALFRQHRYDEAIAAFKASYELLPLPLLLFDSAQAYRLKGDCQSALELYRRYLRAAPDAFNRATVEVRMGDMERCVNEKVPPPADEPQAEAPKAADAPPPPSSEAPPPLKLLPPKRPPDPRRARLLQVSGAAVFAVGAAGVATAIYFSVDGQRAASIVAQAQKSSVDMRSGSLRQLDARGQRDNIVSGVLYGVGGAALLSGALVFGLGKRAQKSPRLAAIPTIGGALFTCTSSF
jgi:tetratricopeptide (TPR) repeat protein